MGTVSLPPKNTFDDCAVLRIFTFQFGFNFPANDFLAFLQFGRVKQIKCSCGIAAAFYQPEMVYADLAAVLLQNVFDLIPQMFRQRIVPYKIVHLDKTVTMKLLI